MSAAKQTEPAGWDGGKRLARQFALGFLYWLVFLLVLEPDNILRAIQAGSALAWRHEVVRLAGASLLGSCVTPLLLALVRRFPVGGTDWWRNAAIQLIACSFLAVVLIVVSCLLAAWLFTTEHRPLLVALQEEFVANWLLLVYCIAGFVALAHAVRYFRQLRDREQAVARMPAGQAYLARIPVKARGRVTLLELKSVDWIEAQATMSPSMPGRRFT